MPRPRGEDINGAKAREGKKGKGVSGRKNFDVDDCPSLKEKCGKAKTEKKIDVSKDRPSRRGKRRRGTPFLGNRI